MSISQKLGKGEAERSCFSANPLILAVWDVLDFWLTHVFCLNCYINKSKLVPYPISSAPRKWIKAVNWQLLKMWEWVGDLASGRALAEHCKPLNWISRKQSKQQTKRQITSLKSGPKCEDTCFIWPWGQIRWFKDRERWAWDVKMRRSG